MLRSLVEFNGPKGKALAPEQALDSVVVRGLDLAQVVQDLNEECISGVRIEGDADGICLRFAHQKRGEINALFGRRIKAA